MVDSPTPGDLSWRLLAGERVASDRIVQPSADAPSYSWVVDAGEPNHACVALLADGKLLGMIAVDMLPTDRTIGAEKIAVLELLADQVAVAVSRSQGVAALRTANESLCTHPGVFATSQHMLIVGRVCTNGEELLNRPDIENLTLE